MTYDDYDCPSCGGIAYGYDSSRPCESCIVDIPSQVICATCGGMFFPEGTYYNVCKYCYAYICVDCNDDVCCKCHYSDDVDELIGEMEEICETNLDPIERCIDDIQNSHEYHNGDKITDRSMIKEINDMVEKMSNIEEQMSSLLERFDQLMRASNSVEWVDRNIVRMMEERVRDTRGELSFLQGISELRLTKSALKNARGYCHE